MLQRNLCLPCVGWGCPTDKGISLWVIGHVLMPPELGSIFLVALVIDAILHDNLGTHTSEPCMAHLCSQVCLLRMASVN